MTDILTQLEATIAERIRSADSQSSYVAQLSQHGLNKILEKVGEESIETILAAKDAHNDQTQEHVVNETADLVFHLLVMLAELGIPFEEVTNTLARRMGVSGIEEKAARGRKE